ncbi:collectin-11 [Elysia marginata]|uniref:Collectin-11 n=1 Tax=Elysia marginata TaxID=1093978 RepID=A0AAV4JLY6_9GAST|nr:collectin-11 [Elysia marginata]
MIRFAVAVLSLMVHSVLGADNATVSSLCPQAAVEDVWDDYYFSIAYGTCFLFATYESLIYEEAEAKCQGYGGTLAMPKTSWVNNFILSELDSFELSDVQKPLWIGINDKEEEGKMVWVDGTPVDKWDNFAGGNGGLFGGGEDCIALDYDDGMWHDYGCNNTGWLGFNAELPYICEFPIQDDNNNGTSLS